MNGFRCVIWVDVLGIRKGGQLNPLNATSYVVLTNIKLPGSAVTVQANEKAINTFLFF